MIQLEYDKEYDRSIDSMEKRYNGESKGIYTCEFVLAEAGYVARAISAF